MRPSDAPSPHSEIHPTPACTNHARERWVRIAVLLAIALLYFPLLGSFGLWDPWEVHYGEAGRQLLERGDWLSPWWGSHWETPHTPAEGDYFFSKPILLLWTMGIGIKLLGQTALAVRLGTTIIAVGAVYTAYTAGERIWSRRVGLSMALVLGTSPFFAMLARQAQTDMPFVGLMSIALFSFMAAVFGRDREEPASPFLWRTLALALGVFSVWQLHIITIALLPWRSDLPTAYALLSWGPFQALLFGVTLLAIALSWMRAETTTRRQLRLMIFYTFVALATLAKGLLGGALPGAIIFFYVFLQRDWTLLRRVELVRGLALTLAVGLPWYWAMIARHGGFGGAFWTRFIIHDHFKRLASGVHQIDTGSFEHFVRWLGYGLFPWVALLPAGVTSALARLRTTDTPAQTKARNFILVWLVVAYALFTASSTKFHHYIFPAVPALATWLALTVDDLYAGRVTGVLRRPLAAGGLVIVGWIGWDLFHDLRNLKNMFTYNYDRLWPEAAWEPGFQAVVGPLFGAMAVGVGCLVLARTVTGRRVALGILGSAAVAFAAWATIVYMPVVSQSWSQEGLWQTYHARCTPIPPPPGAPPSKRYCQEPILSYKLNWRGETFFSQNESVPIRDDDDWTYFQLLNEQRCFYAVMDDGRTGAFRRAVAPEEATTIVELPTTSYLAELEALDRPLYLRFMRRLGHQNNKFALLRVNCGDVGEPDFRAEETVE